ncbi:MAG TPA: hypothetical protein VI385_09425 [Flavisolibacter sp.]|jgi:hypothetical protein
MSTLDSKFLDGNFNTLEKKYPPSFLSLNEVLQLSLKKAQAQVDKVKLIVRCETLPRVKAEQEEMVKLFDGLLGMILNSGQGNARLFLYIDCEEDTTDVIDMNLEAGLKRYFIKFHTNIVAHDNWKLVNSQSIIGCRQILSRHNGNLAVNDISSSGCLFSVWLPGKIE